MRWWILLVASFLLLAPATAEAAPESHDVCFRWGLELTSVPHQVSRLSDASPRITVETDTGGGGGMGVLVTNDAGEAFGRSDQPQPLLRILARIVDLDGNVLRGWGPLDDAGCSGAFDADANVLGSASIEWLPWSVHPGLEEADGRLNHMVTYDCGVEPDGCVVRRKSFQFPLEAGGGQYDVVFPGAQLTMSDRLTWGYAFSEFRVPLHDNLLVYAVHLGQHVEGARTHAARRIGEWPSGQYARSSPRRKYVIAHELGHIQTQIVGADDFGASALDYCLDTPKCEIEGDDKPPCSAQCGGPFCMPGECGQQFSNHSGNHFEWQHAAIIEGFAQWYSLEVWNDTVNPPSEPADLWITGAVINSGNVPDNSIISMGTIFAEDAEPDRNEDETPSTWGKIFGQETPFCVPVVCASGEANEMDWGFALWEFNHRTQADPDHVLVGRMFQQVFEMWPPVDSPELVYPTALMAWNEAWQDGFEGDPVQLANEWNALAEKHGLAQ